MVEGEHAFVLKEGTDMMCAECGGHLSVHPDKFEYFAKREMDTIIEHGHEVRGVFATDEEGYSFAYTIGRTLRGRPELIVTGQVSLEGLYKLVEAFVRYDDGVGLEPGEVAAGEVLSVPAWVVEVGDLEEAQMFGVTRNFGTDDTRALQVVWPDSEGCFPWDEGWEYGDGAQPVFGRAG